jgi:UDP-2,4-diacetamido-2,4,6-trideoxy-beta-L-altropyranose hydrolase
MPSAVVAFRCDGGERVGAGHVARCLPLAAAFANAGHRPVFCGAFDGFAAWLLDRAGQQCAAVDVLDVAAAAVVDLYDVPVGDVCALAQRMPVCTIGEAVRCPDAGVHLDFHADRNDEQPTDRVLPGTRFAPVDPVLAQARRDRSGEVATVLVTLGASEPARALAHDVVREVREAFPAARIVTAGLLDVPGVEQLPAPSALSDHLAEVDVAVSAAGHTSYELACAGVPTSIFAIAPNQERVAAGARATGYALVGSPAQLADGAVRARLQEAGPRIVDGRGAERAAAALAERWSLEGIRDAGSG